MSEENLSAPTTVTAPEAASVTSTNPAVEVTSSDTSVVAPESVKTESDVAQEVIAEDTAKVTEEKTDTLLGDKDPVKTDPEEKTAEPEVKPIEDVKPEEVTLPVFEKFTLPENYSFESGKVDEFSKSLGEFELASKASHEEVQKLGQQMIDRHIAEMERYTKFLTDAWNKQANDWKDSFQKSPEFSNRQDTVLNAARNAISLFGGDETQQKEFRDLMESSKVGNHPAMIRLLSNVMLAKAEPKPLAAPAIAPKEKVSKISKMYGRKS